MIVTLDPGLNGCGVAWGTAYLQGAFYVPSGAELGDPAEKGFWSGANAAAALQAALVNRGHGVPDLEVVTETMQVYRGMPVNPKWLLALNVCAGAFASALQVWASQHARVYSVCMPLPRAWKGTLDGDKMTQRIKGLLTLQEKACIDLPIKSLAHNVYDACGLYLWATGRLKKQRVIHR